ncbi:MAG TPA: response regulator transcription factor [Gallionella sp.]|nr:response regulator transcription factor [Gallionella sp.]
MTHFQPDAGAPAAIRLMLVDDHQLVRDGLRARLGDVPEISVVGEAGNARQALSLAAVLRPNLILVDVQLPDMSGIELTSQLVDLVPGIRVMILSMYDNREYVLSTIRAGACGYVLKDAPSGEIIAAIKMVAAGGSYYSAAVAAALIETSTPAALLTDREREVLILLAHGASNKSIALKLDVSVRTIEAHRLSLRRKLNIDTSAQLTKHAIEQGWTKLSDTK